MQAHGGKALSAVTVGAVDARSGRIGPQTRRIDCDVLAVSGGFAPTLHLWSHPGRKPVYDAAKLAFVPDEAATPLLLCAGACAGEDTLSASVATGFAKGAAAARLAGHARDAGALAGPDMPDGGWQRDAASVSALTAADGKAAPMAFVDLQHDVKTSDIALAHREGYVSVEHMKRYTTTGMATDQGKTSNLNALAGMAQLRGRSIPQVGTTTFRPPFTPIAFGAIVGHETGHHFRPTRLSPMHDWHAAHGAKFIDAGLWERAWVYPKAGEGVREAYIREAAHVRNAVGIVDVSSLGKIAVQGPDAAEFLDRVYTNAFKALKVGRLRYGVMLRDDGFVLDDGTTARLSETEFVMSTTTANAGKVMADLERLLQTAWTSLKVQVTSVSDQWAAIAVAGPTLARAAAESLRFELRRVACGAAEHGFDVWRNRRRAGAHPSHELFRRTGLRALHAGRLRPRGLGGADARRHGLRRAALRHRGDGRAAHREGPCRRRRARRPHHHEGPGARALRLGQEAVRRRVLRKRPVLEDPARPSLVGLEAIDRATPIKSGSLLFSENVPVAGHGEGHVTSTTFSPALGGHIGLALLARGQARLGETIRCVDLLGNSEVKCRVVSPCFVDPEGARQNA